MTIKKSSKTFLKVHLEPTPGAVSSVDPHGRVDMATRSPHFGGLLLPLLPSREPQLSLICPLCPGLAQEWACDLILANKVTRTPSGAGLLPKPPGRPMGGAGIPAAWDSSLELPLPLSPACRWCPCPRPRVTDERGGTRAGGETQVVALSSKPSTAKIN
jgi:hypothetical protein